MAASPELKAKIATRLKREFPSDTVDVSDGFHDNVHVIVVSRRFDEFRSEKEKQEFLWHLVDDDLDEDEKRKVSLILPLSPAELK